MRSSILLAFLVALPARAGELRVGAASVAITPVVGTPMAGYYRVRGAEGVHDDLFAKALVLESGGTRAAMVALDLISTPLDLIEETRAEIARTTGLRGEDVMISATHAHTGPILSGPRPRDADFGGGSELARSYRAGLPAKIAEAVAQAERALVPAAISAGAGHEASIAFNRRFHMTDGSVGWNPGKLNPKILKPAGTIDPEVPIVAFEATGADRRPIATYVNYAVHLDNVGGAQISADLPHTLAKLLAEVKGTDMVTIYTAGCCGDINHIDVRWPDPQKGLDNAARMGIILAGEVLRTLPRLKPIDPGALRVRRAIVELPPASLGPDDLEQARAVVAHRGDPNVNPPDFLGTVRAYKVLDVAEREGRPIPVEVQVIALGDQVAWVSLPGEIFVELGLAIKQDSPFRRTIVAELANGAIGYIPSRRAYPQGNYEVVSARCAEGSGEMLVVAALGLLEELYLEANADAAEAGTPGSR